MFRRTLAFPLASCASSNFLQSPDAARIPLNWSKGFDARELPACKKLKRSPAACRNVRNFVSEPGLLDRRHTIAATNNGRSSVRSGVRNGPRNRHRSARERRFFEHTKRPVPYNGSRSEDFLAEELNRFWTDVEAYPIGWGTLDSRELRLSALFGRPRQNMVDGQHDAGSALDCFTE